MGAGWSGGIGGGAGQWTVLLGFGSWRLDFAFCLCSSAHLLSTGYHVGRMCCDVSSSCVFEKRGSTYRGEIYKITETAIN